MAARTISDHSQITAVCVNFALDAVAAEVREELARAPVETAEALRWVLTRLEQRRLSGSGLETTATAQ